MDPHIFYEIDCLGISQKGKFFGLKNGTSVPLNGQMSVELSYPREKKPKYLSCGPVDPERLFINPSLPLLEFDHVFAIDTNNRIIRNQKVSVACIAHCYSENIQTDQAVLRYTLAAWFEFRNIIKKPENVAWCELILAIQNEERFKDQKIALLVDSDLGCHERFNNRELPIFDEFFLPDNFSIIYATTDSGGYLINKIISLCDKRSKDLLAKIEVVDDEDLLPVQGKPYSHFRQWHPLENDSDNKIAL